MEWKMQGRRVIHQSGFSVSLIEGSFAFPYEISYENASGLTPHVLARLIRAGLAYGRCSERLQNLPRPSSASRVAKVHVKRRRVAGGRY